MSKLIRSCDKNYIEFCGQQKGETEKAILFDDGNKKVWLPKSQIEDITLDGDACIITIPEWLAQEKELI
jgi:hypothetical protein